MGKKLSIANGLQSNKKRTERHEKNFAFIDFLTKLMFYLMLNW